MCAAVWLTKVRRSEMECSRNWGLLKPGIGWDWPGSTGTRSRVLAFGTVGSGVPGFDVIAITDIICFLPLAINDSDAMCIVIVRQIDLLQGIDQLYLIMYNNISSECIII